MRKVFFVTLLFSIQLIYSQGNTVTVGSDFVKTANVDFNNTSGQIELKNILLQVVLRRFIKTKPYFFLIGY